MTALAILELALESRLGKGRHDRRKNSNSGVMAGGRMATVGQPHLLSAAKS